MKATARYIFPTVKSFTLADLRALEFQDLHRVLPSLSTQPIAHLDEIPTVLKENLANERPLLQFPIRCVGMLTSSTMCLMVVDLDELRRRFLISQSP